MARYMLRRVLALLPVLLITAIIAFFITNWMPGDPVRLMLGEFATEEQVLAMREALGYDQALPVRFVLWLKDILSGNLGESIFMRRPVVALIVERLEPTLLLAVVGMVVGVGIGLPLGLLSAMRQGRWQDRLGIGFSLIGISVPSFFIAIVLILVFGVHLGWLPVAGYVPLARSGIGVVQYLLLPGISLGLMQCGLIARMTRSAMLDVLQEDYIRTARGKGLSEQRVYLVHALRNALNPIMTVIGFSLAALIGGTWIIETVFNIPGVGHLAITAILRRDYPLIQGCLLFSVVVYILVNLLIDVCYALLNPRIRYR